MPVSADPGRPARIARVLTRDRSRRCELPAGRVAPRLGSFPKDPGQPLMQLVHVTGLAFPDDRHAPASRFQHFLGCSISSNIGVELGRPLSRPRSRTRSRRTARVPVPKAAMNEDRKPPARQHDVGRPGQVTSVEPEASAERVQRSSDAKFGRGILGPNGGHHAASHGWRDDVGHTLRSGDNASRKEEPLPT